MTGIEERGSREKAAPKAKERKGANRRMIVRLMDARFVGVGTIPKRGAASTVGDYMYVNFASVNIQCMHVTAAARARTPLGVPQRVEEEEAPDGAKRWILPQIRPRQEAQRGAHVQRRL